MNLEQIKQRVEDVKYCGDAKVFSSEAYLWAADTILQLVAEVERLNSLNQMLKEKLTIIRSFGDNTTFTIADAAIKAADKVTK